MIECKNYTSKAVSVDEVEEFELKVRQVAGSKGVMVSRTSFQSGTLEFAPSKRIALLRYYDGNDFKWMLHRAQAGVAAVTAPSRYSIDAALTAPTYRSRHHNFYCAYGEVRTNSLRETLHEVARTSIKADLLANVESHAPSPQRGVAYRPREEIEERAEAVLRDAGYASGPAPLDEICRQQLDAAGLSVRRAPTPPA